MISILNRIRKVFTPLKSFNITFDKSKNIAKDRKFIRWDGYNGYTGVESVEKDGKVINYLYIAFPLPEKKSAISVLNRFIVQLKLISKVLNEIRGIFKVLANGFPILSKYKVFNSLYSLFWMDIGKIVITEEKEKEKEKGNIGAYFRDI